MQRLLTTAHSSLRYANTAPKQNARTGFDVVLATRPIFNRRYAFSSTKASQDRKRRHHEQQQAESAAKGGDSSSDKVKNRAVYLFWILPAITFFLGSWQVSRLQWKKKLIQEKEDALDLEPLSIPPTDEIDRADFENRRVKCEGEFIHSLELPISPRTMEGRPGTWIVTPFRLTDGRIILVNRGWVPLVYNEAETRPKGQIKGRVELDGIVRHTVKPTSMFTPENVPEKNQWYWIDVSEMARLASSVLGEEVTPFFLDQCGSNRPTKYPAAFPAEVHIRNDHLSYIITWYTLTAALSFMTRAMIKKRDKAGELKSCSILFFVNGAWEDLTQFSIKIFHGELCYSTAPDDAASVCGVRGMDAHKMMRDWLEAPRPFDDEDRLQDLYSYMLLDSPDDMEFDRITSLCGRMFDAASAGITLVDRDRLWIKSAWGVPVFKESPRKPFCSFTILEDRVLVVENGPEDEAFRCHPIITQAGINFYAGAPLKTKKGFRVGTIFICSVTPRIFDEKEKKMLADLAAITVQAMELRVHNIQEKKKQEEMSRRAVALAKDNDMLYQALDTFPDGTFLYSFQQKKMLFVNGSLLHMTGRTEEESHREDLHLSEFIHFDGVIPSASNVTEEFQCTLGGSNIWSHLHVAPVSNYEGIVFGILTDITRKKEDQLLYEKNQREVVIAAEAKTAFLANMSHEIRTPLNAICASSELLQTTVMREQRELAEMIDSAAHTLLALVNDIFDYGEIHAGRVDLHPTHFDLRDCLEGCMDMLHPRAAAKGLPMHFSMTSGVPRRVFVDEARLRQILINLISNAITFTHKGEVEISVDRVSDSLIFCVRDTGIGIESEHILRLFQNFTQIDPSRTRRYGGTGLGLAISQGLATALKGSISVQSVRHSGSAFTLSIPFEQSDVPRTVDKRRLSTPSSSLTPIMVITRGAAAREVTSALRFIGRSNYTVVDEPSEIPKSAVYSIILTEDPEACGGLRKPIVRLGSSRSELEKDHLTWPLKAATVKRVLDNITNGLLSEIRRNSEPPNKMRRRISILIVEDNKVNQKVLSNMLRSLDYRADISENGLEAVKKIEDQHYDIVFMDLQMPVMDGLEATRKIRENSAVHQPQIIAVTADVLHGIEEQCKSAGMQGYMAKPVRKHQIEEAIERIEEGGSEWLSYH
ncbi:multi-sensor hybrid histidine kinase [Planoprotostelium fungivorum]|uniref:Multi-sensor hybrid histidine kinase n=1 Tax=Planoprotostelium fungivorum TaxID=1890364 RepID=A0A2P6NPN3_9EUKA|nr:multi-sensor hybrid histidine kinase [Planoprotostelium fungivorum]